MSAAVAAAAAAALSSRRSVSQNQRSLSQSSSSVQNGHQYHHHFYRSLSGLELSAPPTMSRYESQKRQDWNTFLQYLKNHHCSPLKLSRCNGDHVIEFLRYLSQTKTQASLDALISRLRVAFEENGGPPETNPFCSRVVRLYLEEVKSGQAKALA